MTVVMDSDCLIKVTKAGLKETICSAWKTVVPGLVRTECVERTSDLPDAVLIAGNIGRGLIEVRSVDAEHDRGEDAALHLYQRGGFDAIATDDVRFIRRLRGLGVPFAVPAVIVVRLARDGVLSREAARRALASLRPYISADEHAAGELLLSSGG